MGTQDEIAKQIQDQGADYVLALKGNHPTWHRQVSQGFEKIEPDNCQLTECSTTVEVESGHHRDEERRVCAVSHEVIGERFQEKCPSVRGANSLTKPSSSSPVSFITRSIIVSRRSQSVSTSGFRFFFAG